MAPKVQERKSNVRIKKLDEKDSGSTSLVSTIFTTVFGKSLYRQLATTAIVAAVIVGFVLYRTTAPAIQNLVNADADALKDAFFGEKPHLFYCARTQGGSTAAVTPPVFADLNVVKGKSINFAIVNCSQVLPSGKTIFDRFKLKQEWKPTIFGVAPWTKPVQVHPNSLVNTYTFKKFTEDSLAPKATVVKSDKQLWQHCGFAKNVVYDDRDITDTCVLLVKGTKFTSTTGQLEQRLVQAYPQVKFAMVDAVKMRMTFEDPEGMPADYFALKVHAMRNGTHYQSMVHPITWDYLNTFVSSAVAAPLYDYQDDNTQTLHLMKVKDLRAKKEREAKRRAAQQDPSSNKAGKSKSEEANAPQAKKSATEKTKSRTSKTPSTKKDDTANKKKEERKEEQAAPPAEEKSAEEDLEGNEAAALKAEELRRERERARREEMERQEREYLFESNEAAESEEANGDDDEAEEEDDSIIEL